MALVVLLVVGAHVALPGVGARRAMALATVVVGAIHVSASVFVVLTDYRAFAERARAVAVGAIALGVGVVVYGAAVIGRAAEAKVILGHLPGSDCGQCHVKDEHARWPASLHGAKEGRRGLGCEDCHSVGVATGKLLAVRLEGTENGHVGVEGDVALCLECHGPKWEKAPAFGGGVHGDVKCGTCHSRIERDGEPSWKRACRKCHPLAQDVHGDVTKLETTFMAREAKADVHTMRCHTCHVEIAR